MKKYFLLFFIFFFPSLSLAATELYPEKIDDFSKFETFRDVYKKIYADSDEENQSEIIRRVLEHQGDIQEYFLKSKTQNLTQKDIADFCQLDVPQNEDQNTNAEDIHLFNESAFAQVNASIQIRNLCDYEQQLLRFQNNLSRKNIFRSLFSDDSLLDSPFDIIKDLHKIDDIFYGKKFQEQRPAEPKFLVYHTADGFQLDQESWQDQSVNGIGDNLNNKNYDADSHASSIGGNLAGFFESPGLSLVRLGSVSLMASISSTAFFQPSSFQGTSGEPGQTSNTVSTTPIDKTKPAVKSIGEESLGQDFEGVIDAVLNPDTCPAITNPDLQKSKNTGNFEDTNTFLICENVRQKLLDDTLRQLSEKAEFDAEDKHFGTEGQTGTDKSLETWNKDLNSFLIQAKDIKDTFASFILKPQK